MLFQGVQYGFSIPVLIAGVECEIDNLFGAVVAVVAVEVVAAIILDEAEFRRQRRLRMRVVFLDIPMTFTARVGVYSRRQKQKRRREQQGNSARFGQLYQSFIINFITPYIGANIFSPICAQVCIDFFAVLGYNNIVILFRKIYICR